VGVLIPADLVPEIEQIVSVADTKQKRSVAYWDDLFRKLDGFKSRGLQFIVEKIPPWHIDRYNLNKIMDVVYQRILNIFFRHMDATACRVVLDDYGVGAILDRYLRARQIAGTEIVVTTAADDRFLEARVASALAKRVREKVMEAIRENPDFQIGGQKMGSGNAGDPQTVAWLQDWKGSGQPWPWFVKRSFQTIRNLNGFSGKAKKVAPPIREDILSREFLDEFEQGRLSITSLSVVCPTCGAINKATLLTPDIHGGFEGRCIGCKTPISDLAITLRYYCGYVIPDSNIITGGLLSKDLERSRFFEDFTILFDAIVRRECDTPGGSKELSKLARFAAMGRIGMEEVGSVLDMERSSIQRDELILGSALQYNAILITNDHNMKAAAKARDIFYLTTT
jgi:ribonuclease HII